MKKTFSTLPQISSGQLLAIIDAPFVVNFFSAPVNLVRHNIYATVAL